VKSVYALDGTRASANDLTISETGTSILGIAAIGYIFNSPTPTPTTNPQTTASVVQGPGTTATATVTTTQPPSLQISGTSSSQSSSGLSIGAKAGIGIGAAALAIALGFLIIFLIALIRRRPRKDEAGAMNGERVDLPGSSARWEFGGRSRSNIMSEMGEASNRGPHELEGRWGRAENG
jgi:hypothetical protein